jgi:RNA polymerase sigma factor (TIGR02999 family)
MGASLDMVLTGPGCAAKMGLPIGHPVSALSHDVTELLHAWSAGDVEARDRVMGFVYQELRRRAAAHLRRERPGHTLQPSALVHEAYIRLVDQRRSVWQNRAQFLAVASQVMRRILVDRARARLTTKRSGRWAQVTLDDADEVAISPDRIDLLDLDAALERLAAFDPRKSRIAELRFFGGLSLEETGHVLQVSPKTVERDWQAARAWLFKTLSGRRGDVTPPSKGAARQ